MSFLLLLLFYDFQFSAKIQAFLFANFFSVCQLTEVDTLVRTSVSANMRKILIHDWDDFLAD